MYLYYCILTLCSCASVIAYDARSSVEVMCKLDSNQKYQLHHRFGLDVYRQKMQ